MKRHPLSISYLITVYNEFTEFNYLVKRVREFLDPNDEIIVLTDGPDYSHKFQDRYAEFTEYTHPLAMDFAAHKNYGLDQCKGDYVFQIDADELPCLWLLRDLKSLMENRLDLYDVYRINTLYKRRVVKSKVDRVSRIFKKGIRFQNKIHERPVGYKNHVCLGETYYIEHNKTFNRQGEQTHFYLTFKEAELCQ